MGHITLASPVSHVWFFKGSSSALALILDMSQKNLESVIYYASYLVTELDEEKKKQGLETLAKTIEIRKEAQRKEIEIEQKAIETENEEKKKDTSKAKGEQKELREQELDCQRQNCQT
jgi:DNA-directed RNA polymerase subunit beta'